MQLENSQREHHMTETQPSNPRKRRTIEPPTPQSESSPRAFKKQKQKQIETSQCQHVDSFWEGLSTVYLTRRALREVNRRNNQTARCTRLCYIQPRRPLTRSASLRPRTGPRPLVAAADYLRECEAVTLNRIKQSARHGGLDLSNIRDFSPFSNWPYQRMSSSRSSSRAPKRSLASTPQSESSRTTTTRSSGPYDRNFQQHLIDHGFYPAEYEYHDGQILPPPSNLEEITERLARPRASLSPSIFTEDNFRKFKRADAHAAKEKQVTTSVLPIIEGDIGDVKCVSGGIPFTNLAPLTDGTLKPGNPDIYYGARPEQLCRPVRNELSDQIIPSTQEDLPIVPNFFVAAKGPDGSAAVAKRQASYDGALGARGIQALQSYGMEDPLVDNNAYTFTSTYQDGQLRLYTSHISQSINLGQRPEYSMTQVKGWSLTSDLETFRQGVAAYRNVRELAREYRDQAIEQASKKYSEHEAKMKAAIITSRVTSAIEIGAGEASSDAHELQEEQTDSAVDSIRNCRTPPPELRSNTKSKRSSEQVKQLSPLQRKKHNHGEFAHEGSMSSDPQLFGSTGISQQLEEQVLEQVSDSQSSGDETN